MPTNRRLALESIFLPLSRRHLRRHQSSLLAKNRHVNTSDYQGDTCAFDSGPPVYAYRPQLMYQSSSDETVKCQSVMSILFRRIRTAPISIRILQMQRTFI